MAGGKQVTIGAQGNLQTNSSEVIRASVRSGVGIGYSPIWLTASACGPDRAVHVWACVLVASKPSATMVRQGTAHRVVDMVDMVASQASDMVWSPGQLLAYNSDGFWCVVGVGAIAFAFAFAFAEHGSGQADPPDVEHEEAGLSVGDHQPHLADERGVERWRGRHCAAAEGGLKCSQWDAQRLPSGARCWSAPKQSRRSADITAP